MSPASRTPCWRRSTPPRPGQAHWRQHAVDPEGAGTISDQPRGPTLSIRTTTGERPVRLDDYLTPADLDLAQAEANQWIKALRRARVDGRPFRDRFTHRGDSLWWFAELYLHKSQRLPALMARIRALGRLVETEHPERLALMSGGVAERILVSQAADRLGGREPTATRDSARRLERVRLRATARVHTSAALLRRRRRLPALPAGRVCEVAVFLHSAFWREKEGKEAYLGPVLQALAARVPEDRIHFVGLGPRTNYRSRGWQQRAREWREPFVDPRRITPIEAFAPRAAIEPSMQIWRGRGAALNAMLASADLRSAAAVSGYDAWPIVTDLLAGLSHLQFPWSARAMDEAGAALDSLRPRVAVTYAEAGGWGRALILEARRRGVPVVALQHGFIYRHWLNYLHEADEMVPSPDNSGDSGFPLPALTLVHDGLTARHLVEAGGFPQHAVSVTGSPRLDGLLESARRLSAADLASVRAEVGAPPDVHMVVVAAKFTQIARVFDRLVQASARPDVRLVVKCHPGESPEPYARALQGATHTTLAPASADLGRLLAAARVLVTVNSTAAIEAMALDVPALVVNLPNNLSPFVEAGVMSGAERPEGIGQALERLLYDEALRAELARARRQFAARYQIGGDGGAAEKAVEAILAFVKGHPVPCAR